MSRAKKQKSRVNEAGNYTKPTMRKRIFNRIKAGGKGGKPGQWSARKAQMLAKAYKKAGGGYKQLYFEGIKIPSSTDKEIKKIKRELNGHAMHGNKVWNSTFVLMDVLKSIDIKDNKILDLGCGWGVLTSYLDKKGAISHGIDADPSVEPFFNWVAKESKANP